jgi:WD40 repeat protein
MTGRLFLIVGMLSLCLGAAKAQEGPEVFPQLGNLQGALTLAFSPDGKTLASGAGDETIKLWDVASRRVIRTIGGLKPVALAFSPDGRAIATGGRDGTVKLIDAATGKEVRTFTGHAALLTSIGFAPGGQILASGSEDGTVKFWDVASGRELSTLSFSKIVVSIAFSPDGHLFAANSQNFVIRLWDMTTGREVRGPKGYAFGHFAFSPDGRVLAAGSTQHTIKLWDVASGRELRTLHGHRENVEVVAFSPDGRMLVSSGFDKTVKFWDVSTGRELASLSGPPTDPSPLWASAFAFSPIAPMIAIGFMNFDNIALLDTAAGRELPPLGGRAARVASAQFSPDGRLAAAGGFDGTIGIWDTATGRELRVLHTGPIFALAVSPDGRVIAAGGQDGTIKLWDVASGHELHTLVGHAAWVTSVAFSPDGRVLASGSLDRTVKLWDTASGGELRTLRGHFSDVNSVAFSPDGRVVASGGGHLGADGVNAANAIKLWDVDSGRELRTLIGHAAWVTGVAFSPDGKHLASSSGDQTARLWDVDSGREERRLDGFHGRVSCVALSPDAHMLAVGAHDSTIKLFDVVSGNEIRTLTGHAEMFSSVAFARDGQRLVSASWSGMVKIWNVSSGEERVALVGFTDGSSLAITPDGYYDASSEKAEENLNVRVGSRVFSVASYRNKFYRPDLVKLSLAGKSLHELGFAGLDSVKVAPIVELVGVPASARDQKLAINLRITDGGGGIGLVRLFVNGTAVVQDDQPHPPPAAPGGSVTRNYTVQLAGGANVVRAVAFNSDDSMQSNPAVANINLQLTPQATLHALVVGIQQFKNPNLKLGYSVADAQLFADTLRKYAAPLFKGTPDIKLLTTPAETTREALIQTLKTFQSSVGPDDLFIFYVASHGIADNGEYFLITSNVGSLSSDHLKSDAINKEELTALIANVAATKKLMVIDTCHAEALGNALQASLMTRGLDETTALKILSRAVGTTVLAASTSTQSALEGYQDHGLFTFVVADGLRGAADVDQNGFVNTLGLAHYVDRQVPQLAERQFNEAQYPVVETNGQAFPLTKVK